MKKLFAKLTMLLIVLTLSTSMMAQSYSGGSGTSGSPYQISNKADLKYLSEHPGEWTKYFKQTADIAFVDADFQSSGDFYNGGEGFLTIGNTSTQFTGSYNGDNHEISNLYINQSNPGDYDIGFFGYAVGASITNLTLSNFEVKGLYCDDEGGFEYGSRYVGGLAGYVSATTINNCNANGSVTGYIDIGGLVGRIISSSTITNCSSSGSVIVNPQSTYGSDAGGLIGRVFSSDCSVSNSSSTANVESISPSGSYCGGFVGYNKGTISNCYATGNVTTNSMGVGQCH